MAERPIKKPDLKKYVTLDLFPDPVIIIRPNGSIYDINTSCAKLIGSVKEDVLGTDFNRLKFFKKLKNRVSQSIISKNEDFERFVFNKRHFEVLILPLCAHNSVKLIRIVFKEITHFVRLEKELLKRNKELIITSTLSRSFISSDNLDHAVEDLLEKVLLITDFSVAWLFLKEDNSFKLKAGRGVSSEFRKQLHDGALEGLCADVLKREDPLHIIEPADIDKMHVMRKEGIASLTVIPLLSDKVPIGFLFIASRDVKADHIDFDIAALLSLVGNTVSLILEKITLFQETQRLSITDGLTGLYNRRYFYKYLDFEIARARRYGNSFSLMLFDIDNFKIINDKFGHLTGDEVLQNLAAIFKSVSRETDIVVRYGGEEFIIVLPNTSEAEAISLANRIRSTVQRTTFQSKNRKKIRLTLSGGIASYPQNACEAQSLLNAADSSLYAAKAAGKNKVLCFKGLIHEKDIQKVSES